MKALKLILPIIISIFLVSFISAVNPYGYWEDDSQEIAITNGESVNFHVYILSGNPPMIINVKLYDSEGNEIYPFLENQVINGYSFAQSYTINSAIYGGVAGNYDLVITATDAVETDSYVLTLTVNPIEPPQPPAEENNAPVITSTAVTEVDENTAYSYDVNATDADSDTLTYSLTQKPEWLSIESSTGLISGTSPSVNSDMIYNIIISVSDGEDSVTQEYTLTVKETSVIPPEEDTTAPEITIISPENGRTYTSPIEYFHFVVIDENLDYCTVDDGTGAIPVTCDSATLTTIAMTSNEGVNIWTIYAVDSYGNEASESVVFSVDTSGGDTEAPIIIIISPEEAEYDDDTITFEVITNEEAVVQFSLDGKANVTMRNPEDHIFRYTVTGLSNGEHEVVFYATDAMGNMGEESIEFSVNAEEEEEEPSGAVGLLEEGSDEQAYLNQFKPKTIYLDEPEEKEELSWFQKIIQAIINFFKRLFGLE